MSNGGSPYLPADREDTYLLANGGGGYLPSSEGGGGNGREVPTFGANYHYWYLFTLIDAKIPNIYIDTIVIHKRLENNSIFFSRQVMFYKSSLSAESCQHLHSFGFFTIRKSGAFLIDLELHRTK